MRLKMSELAKEFGTENIRVFFMSRPLRNELGLISYTSSSDEEKLVEARIDTIGRHDVTRNYKFCAVPLETGYAHEEFYNMDFESMCRDVPDCYFVMVGDKKIEAKEF